MSALLPDGVTLRGTEVVVGDVVVGTVERFRSRVPRPWHWTAREGTRSPLTYDTRREAVEWLLRLARARGWVQ